MAHANTHTHERITAWASASLAFIAVLTLVASMLQTRWQLNALRSETEKQIAELRDEERIKHLVEEDARFDDPAFLSIRKALAAARIDTVHESLRPLDADNPPAEIWDVLNHCDHVGLLTHRGYLDVRDVWSDQAYWLFPIYADARPAIEIDRKSFPASMVECSWLIEAMRPIEEKEDRGKQNYPKPDDIYNFYEAERDPGSQRRPHWSAGKAPGGE